jgi:hypothetical protein
MKVIETDKRPLFLGRQETFFVSRVFRDLLRRAMVRLPIIRSKGYPGDRGGEHQSIRL